MEKDDENMCSERVGCWKRLIQEEGYSHVYMDEIRQWKASG